MIGRRGERGSGISVLVTRHDDDDDDIYIYVCVCVCGGAYRVIVNILGNGNSDQCLNPGWGCFHFTCENPWERY